uniref:LAGLIDADG homing endonuclease n=1 Tax=Fomitiporia mediterranea TaxID=208960 RepID=A0A5B9R9D5_9AGAM|nr:LAGLIDADG homing endonuclease [Fomitiporia mediterranea]QEG57058.1 LAGLIDADG homing endonuclease [Fomitiporia mediterranea]
MLLCAGITSISFKYSKYLNIIVTMLKQRSQSAGIFNFFIDKLMSLNILFSIYNLIKNFSCITNEKYSCKSLNSSFLKDHKLYQLKDFDYTSETLRNKTLTNIKKVSIHVPTHLKPTNDFNFGHYLAGLIDGNGTFSVDPKGKNNLQLVISFNKLDASLAYFVKGQLGYGSVRKNQTEIILVVSKIQGIIKVINLINGKLRSISKLNQIKNANLSYPTNSSLNSCENERNIKNFNYLTDLKLNENPSLNNHWFSGFADVTAFFQILVTDQPINNLTVNKSINEIEYKISSLTVDCFTENKINKQQINSNNNNKDWFKREVMLNFYIESKTDNLLKLIKQNFGGNIGFNLNNNSYYYCTNSFGSAKKIINYFDQYHLLSSRHVNFLKWRKTYVIIQDKDNLTNSALDKIIKLKNSINKYYNDKDV